MTRNDESASFAGEANRGVENRAGQRAFGGGVGKGVSRPNGIRCGRARHDERRSPTGGPKSAPQPNRTNGRSQQAHSTRNVTGIGAECQGEHRIKRRTGQPQVPCRLGQGRPAPPRTKRCSEPRGRLGFPSYVRSPAPAVAELVVRRWRARGWKRLAGSTATSSRCSTSSLSSSSGPPVACRSSWARPLYRHSPRLPEMEGGEPWDFLLESGSVFVVLGWLDAHHPCDGFHLLQLRVGLPDRYVCWESMRDLVPQVKARQLVLPPDEPYLRCAAGRAVAADLDGGAAVRVRVHHAVAAAELTSPGDRSRRTRFMASKSIGRTAKSEEYFLRHA